MSGASDPAWLWLATRLFDACLWLYPSTIRRAHGEEMRQVFRDRCLEVATGRTSAWRLFGAELLPDLATSLGRAHVDSARGTHDARLLTGVLLLATLAVVLSTQPMWSGPLLNVTKDMEYKWRVASEARELRRFATVATRLGDTLAARPGALATAEAALVHRVLYDQLDFSPAIPDSNGWPGKYSSVEATRLSAAANAVIAQPADAASLTIALQACVAQAGCDLDQGLRKLLARDPDNALAWMLEFKRAAQLDDGLRMAAAVAGAGRAQHYDSYSALLHRDLFAAARRLSADDAGLLEDAAWLAHFADNAGTEDFLHDLRFNCSVRQVDFPHNPRWVDLHPESRAPCLHLAGVLAGSTEIRAANWGWRQLRSAVAATPARERANRDAMWWATQSFSLTRHAEGHGYEPWSADDWRRWADSWAPGDGEIPALRRWLRSSRLPEQAPADFDADLPGGWSGVR